MTFAITNMVLWSRTRANQPIIKVFIKASSVTTAAIDVVTSSSVISDRGIYNVIDLIAIDRSCVRRECRD